MSAAPDGEVSRSSRSKSSTARRRVCCRSSTSSGRACEAAARKRGVIFDAGHGGGSFLFRQAVPAMQQGFHPDVISTDLHIGSQNSGMKDILNTMSKFLNMGMPIADVIKGNTSRAAEVIKRTDLGHLGVGAEADIAVLNLRRGKFGFIDTQGGKLVGDQKLECELTVKAGRVVWDLNGISRPLWTEKEGSR